MGCIWQIPLKRHEQCHSPIQIHTWAFMQHCMLCSLHKKESCTQESKICNEGTIKYQLHSVLHWIKKSFMSAFVTHKIRTQCLQNMHYALLNDENSPNFVSWEAVLRFGWKRLLSPSSSWRGGLMLLSEEEWS